MRVTARDQQIIQMVYEYRLVSSEHIEALLFRSPQPRGRRSSCQRRLQLLYHHQFVGRLALPVIMSEGRTPFVYVLDEAGITWVAAHLGVARATAGWQPKSTRLGPLFIDHLLAINDVRVVVAALAQSSDLTLAEWISEADFRGAAFKERVPFKMRGARVTRTYPDGYFRLAVRENKPEAHFFLEVDQGTMSATRWKEKITAYTQFRSRGLSETHFGTQNFRVLTVTTSDRRLANLKRATESAEGDRYFWFTTQAYIDIWKPKTFLEPVWSVATQEGTHALFG